MKKNPKSNLDTMKVPDTKEEKLDSRIENVWQAWSICKELEDQDEGRAKKRSRIFKAFNLFPPSEYSKLFEADLDWQSNVPFGMLRYRVNNAMSSFIDMVTERPRTMEIKTKHGTPKENVLWSDGISDGFEKALAKWDDRLMHVEQDVQDMLLYSKGIEMAEDKEGCTTEHISSDDLLVPNGTKVSLKNFDLIAVKRSYTVHELWERIQNSGENGWREDAVLNAIKWCRKDWSDMTRENWTKDLAAGNIVIGAHVKENIDCYILFIKEFKKKTISKFVLLRDYASAVESREKTLGGNLKPELKESNKRDTIKKEGFLFFDLDFSEKVSEFLFPFMDNAGSGKWHNIPSLAESVFVQCRQYDFTMNAVMDAIKINMSLLIQGSTPEASEKLKELVFGPIVQIPSDVPFIQQRFKLETQEAVNTIQFVMLDMFQGIGEYRVQERAKGGEAQTATQSQIDAATTAKLTGTQLKRFAIQEKFYYREFYRRMVGLKPGEKDYELLKCFLYEMKKLGVPKEAYKFENIESFTTNVLAGAGSPAYKLNAAMKTIELCNISPKGDGQANAIEDAIAAYHGRDQVARYFNRVMPDKSYNERLAGYENTMLASPVLNPKDIQVNPDDNDLYHLNVHFSDSERTIEFVNERIKNGSLTDTVGELAGMKLFNQIGHILAHIENMARDKGKEAEGKMAQRRVSVLQGSLTKLSSELQAYKERKTKDFDPNQDPDIRKKVALAQIDVSTAEELSAIKQANIANSHKQKLLANEERSAQEIAIQRSKAKTE